MKTILIVGLIFGLCVFAWLGGKEGVFWLFESIFKFWRPK